VYWSHSDRTVVEYAIAAIRNRLMIVDACLPLFDVPVILTIDRTEPVVRVFLAWHAKKGEEHKEQGSRPAVLDVTIDCEQMKLQRICNYILRRHRRYRPTDKAIRSRQQSVSESIATRQRK
jgi:hypothetical protein